MIFKILAIVLGPLISCNSSENADKPINENLGHLNHNLQYQEVFDFVGIGISVRCVKNN